MKRPEDESIKSLIRWPDGTKGYYSELNLLRDLRRLCDEHGYGRVPQLAEQVEDLWRNPDKIDEYLKEQKKHNEFMSHCRKEVEE